MNKSYYLKFGLDYNPFTKNSNKKFIETSETKEANVRLDFLFDTNGIGLVIGKAGLGKTTLLRNYISKLNENLYKVVYVSLSSLTVNEFYSQIAYELGNEMRYKKHINFKNIQNSIKTLYDGKRITPVIIIDEAHLLKTSILTDLKILCNFEMDSKDKLILILCGHSRIIDTLRYESLEDINQRIVTRIELRELNEKDAINYLEQKIKSAGGSIDIFEDGAIKGIISLSKGNPRMIDKIMNNALLIADKCNHNKITRDTITLVNQEINI